MNKDKSSEYLRIIDVKRKEYNMKVKLSTDSLKYLDSILKVLALSLGNYVPEDILLVQVKHPKDSKENKISVLRISTEYLKDKGLIYKLKDGKKGFNYIITLEGMVLFESGGLLERSKNEWWKDRLQKAFWILAFITFAVNTTFQVLNYFNDTSSQATQERNISQDQLSKQ